MNNPANVGARKIEREMPHLGSVKVSVVRETLQWNGQIIMNIALSQANPCWNS